jgi:hypothetical protein
VALVEAVDGPAMSDTGDGLGPDGAVYLHRYLSQADSL